MPEFYHFLKISTISREEPKPFKTLRKAVDAAAKGEIRTIIVLGTLNLASEGKIIAPVSAVIPGTQNAEVFLQSSVFIITGTNGAEIIIRGREGAGEMEQGILSGAGLMTVITVLGESRIRFEHIRIEDGASKLFSGAGIQILGRSQVILGEGAAVRNNHCQAGGGGVLVGDGGTFIMEGGEISGNTTEDSGGAGVGVAQNGTFTIRGGEISGNEAQEGGGISVMLGSFIMSGGARVHTNNAVSLFYNPSHDSSIIIGDDFTGPTDPVAKLDLFAMSEPASGWSGKTILKLADGYNGNLSMIKDRFILGNFIHRESTGTSESPYTYPTVPITGYQIGADGRLETSGQ
jgi:hypothetical protein